MVKQLEYYCENEKETSQYLLICSFWSSRLTNTLGMLKFEPSLSGFEFILNFEVAFIGPSTEIKVFKGLSEMSMKTSNTKKTMIDEE